MMAAEGVAGKKFYIGDDDVENGHVYGLVNIAAFLAQSMKETIQYDACDENSWDLVGGKYPLSNACGQLGQSVSISIVADIISSLVYASSNNIIYHGPYSHSCIAFPLSLNLSQYQDYHCSEEEKHMECPVDPDMSIVGITHAKVRLYMDIHAMQYTYIDFT